MIKDLPLYEKVFFIHYQCEQFDVGRKIFSLSVLVNGKEIQFSLPDEAKNIKNFCDKVNELQREGLRPIHWNQTTHHYGETHIKNRYKELTSKSISLTYIEDINLSAWLKVCYGERYINHPRLDNLALLNKFNTIEQLEKDNITFASVRLKLLSKIYFNIQRGTLITLKPQQLQISKSDEVEKELHNNIFKGNTFLLWFKYYENKNIDVTCKTDLRVIYELMKKDNCFQNTIELKHYINWLNSEFFDGAIMELKKQYFDSRPNQQRLKDYNEYKDNLKTTFK
jgi:hypothetical protein